MSYDVILEFLVQKVEETSVGCSVTLTIGGLVVVGELIPSKPYYDHLSHLFDTYSDELGDKITENKVTHNTKDPIELETLDNYSKDWKKFMTELKNKWNKDNTGSRYIHLQNVEVWEIFTTEPFRFQYWRGKLSSIDGFSLGRGSIRTQTSEKGEQPAESHSPN